MHNLNCPVRRDVDKSERVEGQESFHTAVGPTGLLMFGCSLYGTWQFGIQFMCRSTWNDNTSANYICYEFCDRL